MAQRGRCSLFRICVLLPLALLGCKEDLLDGERRLTCELSDTGRELDGRWHLTAKGTRFECEDRRLEGALEIETAMAIEVSAVPQASSSTTLPSGASEPDAFVLAIERADYVFELADTLPGLELTGNSNGSCVDFTLIEQLDDGDSLIYDFDGFITDSGFAEGEFSGGGPEDCQVEGTFELEVR